MPRGGARSRSGPPPDPTALRRQRDADDWVALPATGREGDPPEWPLGGRQTIRERELWERLWCKPQAIMWERRGQELDVALYVRRFREAEKPGAPVAVSTWILRMADALGLSEAGLRVNRWRIVHRPVSAPAAGGDEVQGPAQPSARDRLRVVKDGDGGG